MRYRGAGQWGGPGAVGREGGCAERDARGVVRRVGPLNAFATLIFDQLMMVLALGVDRYLPPLGPPFRRVATVLRVLLGPA